MLNLGTAISWNYTIFVLWLLDRLCKALQFVVVVRNRVAVHRCTTTTATNSSAVPKCTRDDSINQHIIDTINKKSNMLGHILQKAIHAEVLIRLLELVLCLHIHIAGLSSEQSLDKDERYSLGKDRYEAIKRDTNLPKYGFCWKNAIADLEMGCKHLTDDMQHRLALKFANCFLDKSGRQTYPCESSDDFGMCTKEMASEAYNTYAEFFTHTQNMCFFLQAQVWQAQTDNTIDRLADNSATVAKQIEDSSKLQSEVINKQNLSLQNQELFLKRGSELKQILEQSTNGVQKLLLEFKDTTSEQRALIFEVFDRVNVLQSLVMGEFTGFYSLIFYFISILITYLLTSTPRTSGARFWIFFIMTINIVSERVIVVFGVSKQFDSNGNLLDEGTVAYSRLWLCRKAFTAVAIFIWAWSAYRFKDYKKINNQLLVEIRKQNSDLKHLLQDTASGRASIGSVSNSGVASSDTHNIAAVSQFLEARASTTETLHSINESSYIIKKKNGSSTGYGTDTDYSCDTDTDDSQASDRTFLPPGRETDSDSDASFWTSQTGPHSRESTPSLLDELHDLRQATPLREMTPLHDLNTSRLSDMSTASGGSPRPRGRPRGSTRRSVPLSVFPRYNLRSRKGKIVLKENPVIETESAEDFTKLVKQMSDVATRNRIKVEATMGRNSKYFSSDED